MTCGLFYLRQGICNWVASFINHVKRRNHLTETSCHLSQVTELLCDIKLFQPVETINSVSILLLPISIIRHALSEIWHQPDMLCIRSIVRHYGFMSNRPLSVYCRPPPAAQMVWARDSKLTRQTVLKFVTHIGSDSSPIWSNWLMVKVTAPEKRFWCFWCFHSWAYFKSKLMKLGSAFYIYCLTYIYFV